MAITSDFGTNSCSTSSCFARAPLFSSLMPGDVVPGRLKLDDKAEFDGTDADREHDR